MSERSWSRKGRLFTDILAENRQHFRNGKAPSIGIRFGTPSAFSTLESTHDTVATLHHRGTFWALAISSVCPILFCDRSRDGVPHPCFLPTTVDLGGGSECAIRDHGLLHDRRCPPAVGCDPIISLINVPKPALGFSAWGGLALALVFQPPMLLYYISQPSASTWSSTDNGLRCSLPFSASSRLLRHSSASAAEQLLAGPSRMQASYT